jgi:3-hydroxyisobutyrate dehydrogenase
MNVGYIGIGNMGGALASRLVGKVALTVFDSNAESLGNWRRDGVAVAEDAPELARNCEIVLTCLPTSNEVREVILGEGGIAKHLVPGSLIVDMTSGDPAVTREISKSVLEHNLELIDAPVSGGPRGAREGTIAIMVGGSAAQFERASRVLDFISANIIHAGTVGSGHSIKLGNNLLNLICRMGTFEVVSMLVREGVAPDMAVNIIQKSSGRNYATEITLPDNILSGKMNQGFASAMMEKDSNLALKIGAAHDHDMALGKVAQEILGRTIAQFGRDADISTVANLFENETGAKIRP